MTTTRQCHPGADSIHVVDPRYDGRWEQLTRSTTGSIFTSSPWIRAVCDTYGFEPRGTVATDVAGEPIAGLADVEIRDFRGVRISSLPFSDRADPVLRSSKAWIPLASGLVWSDAPFTLRCLDGTPPAVDPMFRTEHRAAWHGTSLTGSPADLFGRLHPSARRNVRVAGRNGVEISVSATLEAVREFHALHLDLRKRKYRLLAQPVEFFERIWTEFHREDGIVTMLAFIDGQPVAGALFLVWQDVAYYKFGASLASHLAARPNDALFWTAMQWASSRGLSSIDWGLSELDQPGLVAYKRKWASVERQILTIRSGNQLSDEGADVTRLLTELTRLLTQDDVPSRVTAMAGALLYRYFC
ncbi:lipid II:glycine glycyltransferase FemX [Pseudonocardia hierapolitana]|uniref:lipid II:glycine glycyltransferase FemX n=1 Tax=Pseudonocardia hierapolitana TaxID=1128676 RepID=UPI001478271D|nr:GNAT family N-acetyltransferase [Pseudonocardia hierapolitana]